MSWIWQRLQHFLGRRPRQEELSRQDLYNMDTAVIDEGPFDQEGLIIEAGEVVGETAVLDTDRWKLQATGGNLPARY